MATGKYLLAALLAASAVPAVGGGNRDRQQLGTDVLRGGGLADHADVPRPRLLRRCIRGGRAFPPRHGRDPRQSRHLAAAAQSDRRGDRRFRRGDRDRSQPAGSLSEQGRGPDPAATMRARRWGCSRSRSSAIPRGPRSPIIGRAIANETLGNVREAYYDYRRASELDPDWEDPGSSCAASASSKTSAPRLHEFLSSLSPQAMGSGTTRGLVEGRSVDSPSTAFRGPPSHPRIPCLFFHARALAGKPRRGKRHGLQAARTALSPGTRSANIMSAETLDYHHGKHHRAYVDKTNEMLADKKARRRARSSR